MLEGEASVPRDGLGRRAKLVGRCELEPDAVKRGTVRMRWLSVPECSVMTRIRRPEMLCRGMLPGFLTQF
jgi:hypothetical protein